MIAQNGCYEWASTKPDILSIKQANTTIKTCSESATLQVKTKSPFQNIIWITAKDKVTGEILKCETQISLVHSLEINTELPDVVDVGSIRVLRAMGKDF